MVARRCLVSRIKPQPRVAALRGEENQGCEKAHTNGLHGSRPPCPWFGICCFSRKVRRNAAINKACKGCQGSEGRSQSRSDDRLKAPQGVHRGLDQSAPVCIKSR